MVDYSEILTRYKRMRSTCFELNKLLTKQVPREALVATGKNLGFWEDGTMVFDNQDQTCVLFDHAIHGCFKDGCNVVDRYVKEHPPTPGSDEEAVLEALRKTFFSTFLVGEREKGVGVHVLDILRNKRHFLADVGFSQTASESMVLASRVIPFDGFIMTTGAALPVGVEALQAIGRRLAERGRAPHEMVNMSRQEESDLAAEVIAICLSSGDPERIRYAKANDEAAGKVIQFPGVSQVGRNEPCPCGSGKKYKKCCGLRKL